MRCVKSVLNLPFRLQRAYHCVSSPIEGSVSHRRINGQSRELPTKYILDGKSKTPVYASGGETLPFCPTFGPTFPVTSLLEEAVRRRPIFASKYSDHSSLFVFLVGTADSLGECPGSSFGHLLRPRESISLTKRAHDRGPNRRPAIEESRPIVHLRTTLDQKLGCLS